MDIRHIALSILDLFEEPGFLLDVNRKVVWGNAEFAELIGAKKFPIQIESFWPGFLQSEINEPELIATFKNSSSIADSSNITVKLTMTWLSKTNVVVKVTHGRAEIGSMEGLQAQRMETLGALAGGIAHDLNNIITGILGHVAYLQMILPKTGSHVDSLQAIEDGSNRSAQMARQILAYVKQDSSGEPVEVDLAKSVESTCNLLRGAISKRYKLVYEIPPKELNVMAVEGQLTQILVNLVINARDAIEPNGEIRVVLKELTAAEVIDPVGEVKGTERLSGRYACLSVIDNGSGISEKDLPRIFEPYFSTKKERGTGLGLATVKKIVDKAGGVIEISSKIGIGTKVSVYLPIAEKWEGKRRIPPKGQIYDEKILVVDDEQTVRNVLSLSLRELGYRVDTASSGSEAIAKFGEKTEGYDLVILDMVMPELSGRDVFFRLKEIDDNVKVLVCSGFASEDSIKDILRNGGKGFIQKPFDIEDLSRKIRECFD